MNMETTDIDSPLSLKEYLLSRSADLKLTPFEEDLVRKVQFGENFRDTEENSRCDRILRALIQRENESEPSLIASIITKAGIVEGDIQTVIISSFNMEDLGFDFGTKREVAKIELVMRDGRSMFATVSVDRESTEKDEDSPSLREAAILQGIDSTRTWCLQRLLGVVKFNDEKCPGKAFGAIGKEYIPGNMLAQLGFVEPGLGMADLIPKTDISRMISIAVGEAVGNSLRTTGGVPADSNTMNIIMDQLPDGKIVARWCDADRGLILDPKQLQRELDLIRTTVGRYKTDFNKAIKGEPFNYILPPLVTQKKP